MAMLIDPQNILGISSNPVTGQNSKVQANSLLDRVSESFSDALDQVNQAQLNADKKIEEFATSEEKDIHGTMIALEEADISLRLMLRVRSKLTSAYMELMRLQF